MIDSDKIQILAALIRNETVDRAIQNVKNAEELVAIFEAQGVDVTMDDLAVIAAEILSQKGEALEDEDRYMSSGGCSCVVVTVLDISLVISNFAALHWISLF